MVFPEFIGHADLRNSSPARFRTEKAAMSVITGFSGREYSPRLPDPANSQQLLSRMCIKSGLLTPLKMDRRWCGPSSFGKKIPNGFQG
jgi:hypothetical protein